MRTSEYVSLGHPDKVADYISEYLLDRYLEQDPDTRYAVEVQIKDTRVCLGGEVTSKASFGPEQIEKYVQEAVREIGYTKEYADKWGRENTISADDIECHCFISQQSPDIAQGVDRDGWGDQGIFFGYAEPLDWGHNGLRADRYWAEKLGRRLYEMAVNGTLDAGIDIKTQVTIGKDDNITDVVVAIPLLPGVSSFAVAEAVSEIIPGYYNLIINGTGTYVQHGPVADCGTTGRKLVVDFYGGAARIGGGSPWTKDGSKADLALNLYARDVAVANADKTGKVCTTAASCVIGMRKVDLLINESEHCNSVSPRKLIEAYGLNQPIYANLCRCGIMDPEWPWNADKETRKLWDEEGLEY